MALILEDGTGLNPNANSYFDISGLKSYAGLRGIDISALTDPDLEVLMIKAMDYIEGHRDKFLGTKTSCDQPLQWPRKDVWLDHCLQEDNHIPREIEYAQYALAIEAIRNDLLPNRLPSDKGAVIKEKVGDIEVAYESTGKVMRVAAFAKPDVLLRVLLKRSGLTLVRS